MACRSSRGRERNVVSLLSVRVMVWVEVEVLEGSLRASIVAVYGVSK